MIRTFVRGLAARVADDIAQTDRQRGDVDPAVDFPAAFVACEDERGVDHRLHFRDVVQHVPSLLFVGNAFGEQAQARQRRAQIVRDGGEHLRALVDEALEALLHLVEGTADGIQLGNARSRDQCRLAFPAEPIRGARELTERANDAPGGDEQEAAGEHGKVAQMQRAGQMAGRFGHCQPRAVAQIHDNLQLARDDDSFLKIVVENIEEDGGQLRNDDSNGAGGYRKCRSWLACVRDASSMMSLGIDASPLLFAMECDGR